MWIRRCCFSIVCILVIGLPFAMAQDSPIQLSPLEDIEQAEDDPGSQMATAIDSGSIAAVRRLLDSGMSPDTMVYDVPAMQWAIWGDHYYVVKLLVDRGANVNLTDGDGNTSLMCAATEGRVKISKLLLEKGADVNAVEQLYGLSALQNACESGSEETFDLLVERGANIEHTDKFGGNCLEEAAFNGAKGIVEKLRKKGLKTKWPLHVACGIGDVDQVEKLFAEGTDATKANNGWKNTPMHFVAGGATADAVQVEIAMLLKENGANLDSKNKFQCTPLHYAAGTDNLELSKWLVEQGADVNSADENGMTPRDWSGEKVDDFLESKGGRYGEWQDEE